MSFLLDLIPGGGLTAFVGVVLAGVAALGTLLFKTKKAGVDQQKAKEAAERERHIDAVVAATKARNRVKEGDTFDDGFRRD